MKFTLIDRLLMVLAAAVIVLLAFWSLRSAAQEPEPTTSESVPTPCVDAVALAAAPEPTEVPEPLPTPDPSPTPKPDKPGYTPAIPLSEDLQYILWTCCEENDVDPAIALGLIEAESGFEPSADNGLCYGLMQLNCKYFPSELPPGENIQAGLEYLGQLLVQYGTVEVALTAYNAGYDTGSRVYANAVLAAAEKWRDVV